MVRPQPPTSGCLYLAPLKGRVFSCYCKLTGRGCSLESLSFWTSSGWTSPGEKGGAHLRPLLSPNSQHFNQNNLVFVDAVPHLVKLGSMHYTAMQF